MSLTILYFVCVPINRNSRLLPLGSIIFVILYSSIYKTVVNKRISSPSLITELKRLIPDITEKMLSIQLKALEADGLIIRKVFRKKPPLRVEYALSEFEKTLIPALDAIARWGRNLGESKGEIIEEQ